MNLSAPSPSSLLRTLVASLVILGPSACGSDVPTDPTRVAVPDPSFSVGDQVGRDGRPGAQPPSFVVMLRDGADPSTVADAYGVQAQRVFTRVVRGFAGGVSEAARAGLLGDARVLSVERDLEVTTMNDQADPPWGLDRIDQRSSTLDGVYAYQATGAGVTAYVVDTGIRYTHSEFAGRASFGFDALGGDGTDCHGHGTHVAGTIGGTTYGVAKDVALVGVRVLDCSGSGTVSTVVAGLDWVAARATGPSVVNMSLGGGASDALDAAVQGLIDAGIPVAVAAGNSAADACLTSPARTPDAMTVGAVDSWDTRAGFSNYGTCVDWFAPGVGVQSSYIGSDDATATFSGTSMASPHTAGAAALLLEVDPALSPRALRDSLWSHATKNAVADALTENAHVLSTLADAQEDTGDPPTEEVLQPPVGLTAVISGRTPAATLQWQVDEPRADRIDIGLRWGGQAEWSVTHSQDVVYTSYEQLGLEPSTEYEFSVRTKEYVAGVWRYSDWAPSVFGRTCDVSGSGGPNERCVKDGGGATEKGNKGGSGKGSGKGG